MTKEDESAQNIKTLAQQASAACAVHESRIDRMEADIAELKADMKQILATLNQAQGGWRTLMLIGGACGSIGALISWIVSNVAMKHP